MCVYLQGIAEWKIVNLIYSQCEKLLFYSHLLLRLSRNIERLNLLASSFRGKIERVWLRLNSFTTQQRMTTREAALCIVLKMAIAVIVTLK